MYYFFQEFCGVVELTDRGNLESDMSKVSGIIAEVLASCHALVFVDNKLVCKLALEVTFLLVCMLALEVTFSISHVTFCNSLHLTTITATCLPQCGTVQVNSIPLCEITTTSPLQFQMILSWMSHVFR